jgi:hypothetical protein
VPYQSLDRPGILSIALMPCYSVLLGYVVPRDVDANVECLRSALVHLAARGKVTLVRLRLKR